MSGATVSLISNDTGAVLSTTTLPVIGTEWKQYKFTLFRGGPAGAGQDRGERGESPDYFVCAAGDSLDAAALAVSADV